MLRRLLIVGLVALAAVSALLVRNAVRDPMDARRRALEQNLARIKVEENAAGAARTPSLDAIETAITSRETLWTALVPSETPSARPDLDKILAGVVATRHGIGPRVRILTPLNPAGDLYGVGDLIHGVAITSITDEAVVFSLTQDGQTYTKTLARE